MLLFLFAGVRCVVLFIVGFAVSSAVMIGALGLYMEPIWIYMACYLRCSVEYGIRLGLLFAACR